jgi:hypothetical protein
MRQNPPITCPPHMGTNNSCCCCRFRRIFREFRDNAELPLDAAARVGMYRELYGLMRSHFGDDEMGRKKAWYFAPWHHDFFHRYRCAAATNGALKSVRASAESCRLQARGCYFFRLARHTRFIDVFCGAGHIS